MEKFKLTLEQRENKTPNQLRREGKVPATIYGPNVTSEKVQVCEREFSRLPSAAYSHIIELSSGKSSPHNAIIRHVQRKPTNNKVLNIEFYLVKADRKLTVTVPLRFIGSSPAVAEGNQLTEIYQEADIECLPGDIPDFIEVNLDVLVSVEQGIHFSELNISDKIKILNPLDEIIVRVVAPRVVIEDAKPVATDATDATAAATPATPPAAGAAS